MYYKHGLDAESCYLKEVPSISQLKSKRAFKVLQIHYLSSLLLAFTLKQENTHSSQFNTRLN
ncbi:hypothetical protein MTR_7g112565 [Medicago truncatula]|uniref:Uncharacterized protein n=1 Tax=Medicago truncatula TaxID=3880 RepID=A0A072U558_MEDTR|nr:hypothetical protein MTR_7g112565 [Medicago truncatula]